MLNRHRERYHARKEEGDTKKEEERRQARKAVNDRYRRRNKTPVTSLPSTPNSKTKLVATLIETATPTTELKMKELNLKKSSVRSAENDIVNATATAVKMRVVRRELLPKLQSSNKSVVSKRLGITRNYFYYKSQKGRKPRTSLVTLNKVRDFYFREDITTTYPNKTKSGRIIRAMKYTKAQAFKKFILEFGQVIKSTTFFKLRPKEVGLRKKAQWMQCICDPCDNISMLSKAIRQSMTKVGLNVPPFLTDELTLAKSSVCSMDDYKCLDNKCKQCEPTKIFRADLQQWLESEDGNHIDYHLWEYGEEAYKDRKVRKLIKMRKRGLRADLYNDLIKQLDRTPSFALHKKNAIAQLHSYKLCKESLKPDEVIAVVDFAENYVCRQHSESQSAYYGRNSTTVHPMVLIFPHGSNISRDYFDIISNDLKHDGAAVRVFISKLARHLSVHYPHVNTIKVWSDGCGVQYKSRLPMLNMSNNFSIPQTIIWNFFGSRHGKNESDGESAVVKSAMDIATKSEQLTMLNAQECYGFLSASPLTTPQNPTARRHFLFVSRDNIEVERVSLPETSDICAIPNVRRIHQISGGRGQVEHRRLSCYCVVEDCCHANLPTSTFTYPGKILFEQECIFIDNFIVHANFFEIVVTSTSFNKIWISIRLMVVALEKAILCLS